MSILSWDEFTEGLYGKDFADGSVVPSGATGSFMDSITIIIENYVGRKLCESSGLIYDFEGDLKTHFYTPELPLKSIEGITGLILPDGYLDTTIAESVNVNLSVSQLRPYRMGKVYCYFKLRPGVLYHVEYTAGYSDIEMPADLKDAAAMLAQSKIEAGDMGMIASPEGAAMTNLKFGKFSQSFASPSMRHLRGKTGGGLPITVTAILDNYKGVLR